MPSPETQSKLVFSFAAIGHFLFHVLVALYLTIVLVLEVDWQRSYDDLIGLWTVGALLLGLAAPLAGWLADYWGAGRVMVVYFLGAGAATILCGLAAGPESLMLFLGLLGFCGAIYHPVGTAWLVANARARGKAIAALGIFGSVGAAVAALIAGSLIDLASWRAAFIVPGLVAVVAGFGLWILIANGSIIERKQDVQPEPEASRAEVRRAFVALAVAMSLTTIIYYAFTTMLPKWVDAELGMDLGQGFVGLGFAITAIYLLGATSQLVGGYLSDKGAAKAAYVASYVVKALALVTASAISGWPVLAVAALVVFAFDVAAPVESVLIARFSPSHRRGLAYGVRNGIAIVGAPLGVQLVALLYAPGGSFQSLFLLLAALALLILLAALFLPADRSQESLESEA